MIEGKGQVRFSAAEVDDAQGTAHAAGKAGKYILENLQESIDLPEFGVMPRKHFPLGIHDAQADQKVAGRSFCNGVIFDMVMRQVLPSERTGVFV